jgi:hypothetical protein
VAAPEPPLARLAELTGEAVKAESGSNEQPPMLALCDMEKLLATRQALR